MESIGDIVNSEADESSEELIRLPETERKTPEETDRPCPRSKKRLNKGIPDNVNELEQPQQAPISQLAELKAQHEEVWIQFERQIVLQKKKAEDELKQIKKLQAQKDEKTAKEELAALSKFKALEAEVIQLTENLGKSESARRAAEEKVLKEITSSSCKESLMINEKRDLETKVSSLQKELEREQTISQKRESARTLLEKQFMDLKAKLVEVEKTHRIKLEAQVSAFEAKIAGIQKGVNSEIESLKSKLRRSGISFSSPDLRTPASSSDESAILILDESMDGEESKHQ